MIKNLPANAEDACLIPGSGRSPWRGKWLPTPLDSGAWWATVHSFAKQSDKISD